MKWQSLISIQNLKLAWRRINTGQNFQYKRFFRQSYLVYEGAVDKHIKQLHDDLRAKAWEPSCATKLYIPKPSGLHRPISLLGIEDQILLQAIANLFARNLYQKRRKVELKTVFSNKLSDTKDSIFFVEQWQRTYHFFQEKCTDLFKEGYRWSTHFDLSAFYDTISHDLLLSVESQKDSDLDTKETVKRWLQRWTTERIDMITDHGIPQGPIASNFLAEAFFLPIDIYLQKKRSFQYLRYVDDIRLFGRTEKEVQEAAFFLERECRERGLIPHSTKFEIRKLKSAEDAMGALPSIPPPEKKDATEHFMTAKKARQILHTAIDGKPQKVRDRARFRYVMYRAPEDTKFLKTVLRLLPRHPEYIDAFVSYFSNFKNRLSIARRSLDCLETEVPYSYVRGELWHVVARLAGPREFKRGLPIALKDVHEYRSRCVVLSWGVMHFLMRCREQGVISGNVGPRLATEHPISRSLLAPIFSDREFSVNGNIVKLLKGTLMEQLAGARELQKRNVTLDMIGLRQDNLQTSCKTILLSLGVIGRRRRIRKDYIGETLKKLYKCQHPFIWGEVLDSEYQHALQILVEAEARFSSARSEWLGLQDSFNDVVVRQFFDFLKNKNLNGHSKTIGRKGELVKYGSLISKGTPFDTYYPSEARVFRHLHERRNKLPGSHPYDQKGGAQNKWLTKREQNFLVSQLRITFDRIAEVVKQNL